MRTCSCGDRVEDRVDAASGCCVRCSALDALGLDFTATADQIKETHRTLVKVWHPDRFQDDPQLQEAAEARLKTINTAYAFLTSKASQRPQSGPRSATDFTASAHSKRRRAKTTSRFLARLIPSPMMLLKCAVLACGLLICVLLAKAADSYFVSQPITGSYYSELRNGILSNFRQATRGIWGQTGQGLRDLVPKRATGSGSAALSSVEAAETQPSADPVQFDHPHLVQNLHRRELGAAHAEPILLTPYVTTGLTQEEVEAVLGAPTVSSERKLIYGASELDFTGGKLTGWKIDPVTSPLRVKLWPDAPVDPNVGFFHLGSSKSVVLVVQGTPTYLAENQYGYGSSVVYFRDDRVVNWKNDPATVPLHVAP
ncbi:MAG TPA: J domain-containing protein [Terracidiphilus sp.]|nr:J domain-containing protein [Terracidiphilus sp.]